MEKENEQMVNSAATFYVLMLSRHQQLYETLFKQYSLLNPIAKDYILDKIPLLLEKQDIPEDVLVLLLKSLWLKDPDLKLVYKIMDSSATFKTKALPENILTSYLIFALNYHKEHLIFKYLHLYTLAHLELIFPLLSLLSKDQLKLFVEKIYHHNRTLIQTYLVRIHLDPTCNPPNYKVYLYIYIYYFQYSIFNIYIYSKNGTDFRIIHILIN